MSVSAGVYRESSTRTAILYRDDAAITCMLCKQSTEYRVLCLPHIHTRVGVKLIEDVVCVNRMPIMIMSTCVVWHLSMQYPRCADRECMHTGYKQSIVKRKQIVSIRI